MLDVGLSFFIFLSLSLYFSLIFLSSHFFTRHGALRVLLDLGHLHLSKFPPDGSGGLARRTRHARRQGMGPTCLFRRSQRVVERRRVCVVELAIGPFSILVFYTLCLLLTANASR